MAITLALSTLSSRTTRLVSTANAGVRRFAIRATTSNSSSSNNPLVDFYDGLNRFGNSLMQNVLNVFKAVFSFSWTKLWGMCVRTYFFLFNFNWNSTDTQLNAKIQQAEIALAASKGRLAGQTLGFAVCGVIPTATIAVFNEPLALYILKELGEEAGEEIAGALASLIQLQAEQLVRIGFINLFKNYRNILRPAALGIAQVLVSAGILSQDQVDKANKSRNEPWSFAKALDETIDDIKDPLQKSYAEEFYDEFGEACIEAGYIVARGADSFFAEQRMAHEEYFGSEHVIEIEPIRNSDPTPTPTP